MVCLRAGRQQSAEATKRTEARFYHNALEVGAHLRVIRDVARVVSSSLGWLLFCAGMSLGFVALSLATLSVMIIG